MTITEELYAIKRELDRMRVMLSLDLRTKNSIEQKYVQYLGRIVKQSFSVFEKLKKHFETQEAISTMEGNKNESV